MEEILARQPNIFEINSVDDLEKIKNIETLKFVHIRSSNGDTVVDRVFVGDESEIDHWQLTGLTKKDAENTPVFNAGLMVWNQEKTKRHLLGFSGGLKSIHGGFSRMSLHKKEKKKELNDETARSLNKKCNGDYFVSPELLTR